MVDRAAFESGVKAGRSAADVLAATATSGTVTRVQMRRFFHPDRFAMRIFIPPCSELAMVPVLRFQNGPVPSYASPSSRLHRVHSKKIGRARALPVSCPIRSNSLAMLPDPDQAVEVSFGLHHFRKGDLACYRVAGRHLRKGLLSCLIDFVEVRQCAERDPGFVRE